MQDFRTQFNAELQTWFAAKRRQYVASYAADPLFFVLFDAIEELSTAGGKRVRPYIADVLYRAVTDNTSIPDWYPLLALELFHVFGLVHDDIIDGGDTRRGVPTVHRRMIDTYQRTSTTSNPVHTGEAQAMLMGDLVFSWCHELFDESEYTADIRSAVKRLFAEMSEAVMIGQMIDVDLTTTDGATMERIIEKMRLKTATYTFVYPMKIGVALAGGSGALMTFAETFGTALGLGFQIQDDVLDLLGNEETGKTPMRDIAEGQHTLMTQFVYEQASQDDIDLLDTHFRTEIDNDTAIALREMFERSGAIAFAIQESEKYFATARAVLVSVDMPDSARTELTQLVDVIAARHA